MDAGTLSAIATRWWGVQRRILEAEPGGGVHTPTNMAEMGRPNRVVSTSMGWDVGVYHSVSASALSIDIIYQHHSSGGF